MKKVFCIGLILMIIAGILAKPGLNEGDFEKEILRLTNVERKKAGLSKLKYEKGLHRLAKRQNKNMHDYNFFAHQDPFGDVVEGRKDKYYPELIVQNIGENLGRFEHSKGIFSAQKAVEAWMNSPDHKENILDGEYSHLGVGVELRGNVLYATQVFATPIVRLSNPLPVRFGKENTYQLNFEYMAKKSSKYFSAILEYPDPEKVYPISETEQMLGAQPLKLHWRGKKRFWLQLPFVAGRGTYQLLFGYGEKYYQKGIRLLVD